MVRAEAIGTATAVNPVLGFAVAVAACDETTLYQTPEELCRHITGNDVVPDGVHEWEIEGDNRHLSRCTDRTSVEYIVCDPGGSVVSVDNDTQCGERTGFCVDGVCTGQGETTCFDPDRDDRPDPYHRRTRVIITFPDGRTGFSIDSCVITTGELREQICVGNQSDFELVRCPPREVYLLGACVAGNIVVTCFDSDSLNPDQSCDPGQPCEIDPDEAGRAHLEDREGVWISTRPDGCHDMRGDVVMEVHCEANRYQTTPEECGPTESCQLSSEGWGYCAEGRIPPVCTEGTTPDGIPFVEATLENGNEFYEEDRCYADLTRVSYYQCDEENHPALYSSPCPEGTRCVEETASCEAVCTGACFVYVGLDGVRRVVDGDCVEHPSLCDEFGNLVTYTCNPDDESIAVDETISCEHGCADGQCL